MPESVVTVPAFDPVVDQPNLVFTDWFDESRYSIPFTAGWSNSPFSFEKRDMMPGYVCLAAYPQMQS